MTEEKHKRCFKCGETKPLSDFYKHPRMADGHVNKCKECNKKDVRENRSENLDYYREYDRVRGADLSSERYKKKLEYCKTEKVKAKRREYAKKDEVKAKRREYSKRDNVKVKRRGGRSNKIDYPQIDKALKKSANSKVSNALRDNRLIRPSNCQYCGKECKPEAHHSSYSEDMWLVVTWLCTSCHGEVHRLYD